MDVRPGYKLTGIGEIPEAWRIQPLGAIAAIAAGGTPSRNVPEYWGGEIPWVTTTEIDFNTIRETAECISQIGMKNSAAKLRPPGTLLLALYGQGKTRGKVAQLGIPATTNQACASIALRSDVSRLFVFHLLSSRYEAIRGLSNSGSQENLNGQIVRSIAIPLPASKAEQEAIAEALSDADALIESLEQLLAKKRHLKQGAMQELLTGKKRLPGFSICTQYQRTEVGSIPKDWEVSTLEKLAEISSGTTPPRAMADHYYRNGDIAWVKTLDLNNSEINTTEEQVTLAALRETSLKCYPSGSVLVAMYGGYNQIGRTGILRITATINQALTALRPNPMRLHSDFLLRVLNFRVAYWKSVASSSRKDPNITSADIQAFPLALPPLPEQEAIAAVLTDMDAEITALEAKLTKARQLKLGMMQQLLTGRIRLLCPTSANPSEPRKTASSPSSAMS